MPDSSTDAEKAQSLLESRRQAGTYIKPADRFRLFGEKYEYDPVGFARDCIDWDDNEQLADYQFDVLAELIEYGREAVRGPHGLGKSAVSAIAVLWFSLTNEALEYDWKVLTTASGWPQISKYFWPEVHKWARKLKWSVIGRGPFKNKVELLTQAIQLEYGQAFAIGSANATGMEGGHASRLLMILDEAKEIPTEPWVSLEGAFANAGPETGNVAYALAISTPGDSAGHFYNIHVHRPGYEQWHAKHITLAEAIAAGRVSASWAEACRLQWGEDSPKYLRRCLGEFAQSSADAILPLQWINAATARWRIWDANGRLRKDGTPMKITNIGVDVGGGKEGGDASVIALIYDYIHVGELIKIEVAQDPAIATMELAGRVLGLIGTHRPEHVFVDIIGIGAGVVHRLRELGNDVRAYHAGAKTSTTDRSGEWGFVNWRAAGWYTLRELLDPTYGHNMMLPPDEALEGELSIVQGKGNTSTSLLIVESKDNIRKRLNGASTDCADAIIHAVAGPGLFQTAMEDSQWA